MTTKNTGIPYEQLTKRIFETLLTQDAVKNLVVEHDKRIVGKTGTHQIDVYWEFTAGGVKHITIVQCKDWAQPVKQAEVLLLRSILDDIPGQPRGVIVTRTGFQAGAKEVATANGILLYELREPVDADWSDRIRKVVLKVHLFVPEIRHTRPVLDAEWAAAEKDRRGIPKSEIIKFDIAGRADALYLFDEHGARRESWADVCVSMVPSGVSQRTRVDHAFAEPRFIQTGDGRLPLVRVTALSSEIEVTEVVSTMTIAADELVALILKNALTGETEVFDRKLTPVREPTG